MGRSVAWKAHERQTAKKLGGKRNLSNKGLAVNDVADVPRWAVECKLRAKLPALLMNAFQQAKAAACPEQIPLVVLKQSHMKGEIVCLYLDDFVTILKDTEDLEEILEREILPEV